LKIHKILVRETEGKDARRATLLVTQCAVRSRVMRICCVSLSIFVSTIIASARADDFPIKKLSSFTWVVDYEPFWSPDSRQIVLVSSRHGGMKVHVMNADSTSHGNDMRQLTFGNDEDDSPAWSPDGKRSHSCRSGRAYRRFL
jgi:WD40-like Beta Propeller Repeat